MTQPDNVRRMVLTTVHTGSPGSHMASQEPPVNYGDEQADRKLLTVQLTSNQAQTKS